jgi:hypothetical protein
MTLNALRVRIGDPAFFALLKDWVSAHQDSTGTTAQFIALAEQESGLDLASFFDAWLFSRTKPPATPGNGVPAGVAGVVRPVPKSLPAIDAAHAMLTGSRG